MAIGLAAGGAHANPSISYPSVVLQGLDKVTARVSVLEIPLGEELLFGTLAIRPRACLKTPPTEPPESAAFLEIRATDRPAGADGLFTGWMLASSPALSALEHPVYDVWVIDCAGEPLADDGAAGSDGERLLPIPLAPKANE